MEKIKLYTEEQVRNSIKLANECRDIDTSVENGILSLLTPIELPSDEEIEQMAIIEFPVNLQPNGRTLNGSRYDVDINYSERNAFISSAKFLRDKIQGGNK